MTRVASYNVIDVTIKVLIITTDDNYRITTMKTFMVRTKGREDYVTLYPDAVFIDGRKHFLSRIDRAKNVAVYRESH